MVFAFTVSCAITLPRLIAPYGRSYHPGPASTEVEVFFVFLGIVRGIGIGSLLIFLIARLKSECFPNQAPEFLWLLLGTVFLNELFRTLFDFGPIIYLVGGCLSAWIWRKSHWRWFFLLFASTPFTIWVLLIEFSHIPFAIDPFAFTQGAIAIAHSLVGIALMYQMAGGQFSWGSWTAVICQFGQVGVHVAAVILISFGLWK